MNFKTRIGQRTGPNATPAALLERAQKGGLYFQAFLHGFDLESIHQDADTKILEVVVKTPLLTANEAPQSKLAN